MAMMFWLQWMLLKMVVWLVVLGGHGMRASCPHCATGHSLGPPPSAILEMPPPPRLPSFPSWAGPICGGNHSRHCHHPTHHHTSTFNGSAESSGWWLMGPSSGKKLQNNATRGGPPPSDAGPLTCWTGVPAATRGEGDKAWPLAVVLVAGSATVLGSVVLLVLSKKKRWQPGRSSPGHRAGLPAALLPSKGILVGASLPAAGAYDNSAFAENVAITGDGPPRASLLRQLQPPSLGGYRQLPHHQGPPQ
ncbi:uncharacterized protein LOC142588516 isoform X2 [Dermacentor variabilis]|uniref:uncharacterized protein LOC142588516 isoform X2 n=1 Tax=Dermacentor variabilis TaxID=34621 RepID=UPI003F5B39BC